MGASIDTTIKMYTDTPANRDPDTYSRTLRDYHLLLWSKPLPNAKRFKLTANEKPPYCLTHKSDLGVFCLSSDSILHTYTRWTRESMAKIIRTIPKSESDEFYDLASTIGGYIVFPANQIERKPTINGIRGMHPRIMDRFDYTLECIRRWYQGEESPLYVHLERYKDFFQLFESFRGYYTFFLLNDLVDEGTGLIRFWLPFSDFGMTSPLPADLDEYLEYRKNVADFTNARGKRMVDYTKKNRSLDDDEFSIAAEALTWTFAKTMPECPHWYIVKGKTADTDTYYAMYRAIEERGEWREWDGSPQQYLHPGDGFYYWKMTDKSWESVIINRAVSK